MNGEKMIYFKRTRLKYILWIAASTLVGIYVHFMIYFPLDPFKLTLILFAKMLFIATICNLGLALLTLNISKKYKKTSTFLFIPSIIITPLIAGFYFIPAFFIMLAINLYFFIKLNPWKKDEMEPSCS